MFCLDWFVLLLLSYPVGVESACKDCNKVCLSPSQWWLYERKCLRDSASLCYHLLPFPTNTALAVAIMVSLLTWWVTVKVNFYTFIQRHSVFTPVLLPLLCCKIHACDLFNLNRDIEVISLSGKKKSGLESMIIRMWYSAEHIYIYLRAFTCLRPRRSDEPVHVSCNPIVLLWVYVLKVMFFKCALAIILPR